jgi:ribosomal protein S18 acetylase RimI-like enzyme
MGPVTIRLATIQDLPSVRAICLATCTDDYLREHTKTLYLLYADYYLNEEQGHCFVAVSEGKVVGYILSSFSQKSFVHAMKTKYLPILKKSDPHFYHLRKSFLFACHFWPAYPAHLHIDLDPAYQHQGIGTRLMENLIAEMRVNHVRAVYLSVSKSHPNAIAFYRKNGFKTLQNWPGSYVLGRKL